MCLFLGPDDLQSRMNSFPNNLKFVSGVDSTRLQGSQNPWVYGRDDAAAACCCTECGSETVFCFCYNYSRTWTRLEMAATNRDATNIPQIRAFNWDCASFGLGLPFYAFCLGSLQKAVRGHYNIDGDDCQDYCDACCSPHQTLVRAEGEIIFREQTRTGNGEKVDDTQYICYDQMAYPTRQPQQQQQLQQQQFIPAARIQAAPRLQASPAQAGPAQAGPAQARPDQYQYAVQQANPQPRANRRPMHTLEDDLAVAATAVQHDHALGDDIEAAALAVPAPHDLGATAPRPVPVRNETGPMPSSQWTAPISR
ncbi:hypothetical protein ACQKWADRAFT_186894 [Trichoderma austrokoningii]